MSAKTKAKRPKPVAKASAKASAKPASKPKSTAKASAKTRLASKTPAGKTPASKAPAGKATPRTAARPGSQELPLKQIVRWTANPRKNLGDLTELAASLKGMGQIHDLVVRPHPSRPALFEVAAGNRRHAAAELAGLETLRVIVRNLSDAQMLEIAISENGQRSSLTPLEESSALYDLHHEHGEDVREIAARIGRPVSYIHQRMSLQKLTREAEEALAKGRLSLSVALKLARLPTETQAGVLPDLLVSEGSTPRSLAHCEWAFSKVHLTLANAPFSLHRDFPEISAGPCHYCPKRSNNQVNLFEANEKDLCLDPGCFKKKVEADKVRTLNEAKAKGIEVLDAKASREVLGWGGRVHEDAQYIDLDAPLPQRNAEPHEEGDEAQEGEDDGDDEGETGAGPGAGAAPGAGAGAVPEAARPTWKDVLGDQVAYVLAEGHDGKLHRLVPHELARNVLPPTAPEELHQAVAPKEDEDEGEASKASKKAEVFPWGRESDQERRKALLALIESKPVLDADVFRVFVINSLMLDPGTTQEHLEESGLWQPPPESEEHDYEEHTAGLLVQVSLKDLWRLWTLESLRGNYNGEFDRAEKLLAPRPAEELQRHRVLMARAVVRSLAKEGKRTGGVLQRDLQLPHKEVAYVLGGLLTAGRVKRTKGKGYGWDSHWEPVAGALEEVEAEEAAEEGPPPLQTPREALAAWLLDRGQVGCESITLAAEHLRWDTVEAFEEVAQLLRAVGVEVNGRFYHPTHAPRRHARDRTPPLFPGVAPAPAPDEEAPL